MQSNFCLVFIIRNFDRFNIPLQLNLRLAQ